MQWLSKKDFTPQIRPDLLEQLIDGEDANLHYAEDMAIQEVIPYLKQSYDTEAIFRTYKDDETGRNNRNSYLVMIMVDIVLYHLSAAMALTDVAEIRKIRYDNAIMWLKDVRDGKNRPLLPEYDATQDVNTDKLRYGSYPKKTHDF